MTRIFAAPLLLLVFLLGAACSADEGGREVMISQTDAGCAPERISAARGEKLKFVIQNTSGKDKEVEGIDGTKFAELEVPKGSSRTKSWSMPAEAGDSKLKCYIPGGPATIITITAS